MISYKSWYQLQNKYISLDLLSIATHWWQSRTDSAKKQKQRAIIQGRRMMQDIHTQCSRRTVERASVIKTCNQEKKQCAGYHLTRCGATLDVLIATTHQFQWRTTSAQVGLLAVWCIVCFLIECLYACWCMYIYIPYFL